MDSYRFLIKENDPGKIYTPGVSHGYGVGSRVDLVYRNDKFMVVRFPGASDWFGIGMSPEYYGSEYLLCEIVSDDRFDVIERVQPGRKWYKCKKEMIEKCNRLVR